jgi:predicted CXXCH cytochrome family protein
MRIDPRKRSARGRAVTGSVLLSVALLLVIPAGPVVAHIGNTFLTDECGSCHVGHGKSGEPMLAKSEEEFCYQCHGSDIERSRMIAEGRLIPSPKLQDLRTDFDKLFAHPVDRPGGTRSVEELVSMSMSEVTHAECVDCHNPHARTGAGKQMNSGVSGYSLGGQILERSLYEYEICLKCHAGNLNTGGGELAIRRAFATSVRSQHPVTVASADRSSPSLLRERNTGALMKCSDCHRSEDPDGPSGPHGSNHEFMLSGHYDRGVTVAESSLAYEFCYSCHDRFSILGNESFPYHREHVEGDLLTGRRGTSCFSCHASHGSPDYPHLIRFNLQAVSRTSGGLPIQYIEEGAGSGSCVLECHGYEHSPGSY